MRMALRSPYKRWSIEELLEIFVLNMAIDVIVELSLDFAMVSWPLQ